MPTIPLHPSNLRFLESGWNTFNPLLTNIDQVGEGRGEYIRIIIPLFRNLKLSQYIMSKIVHLLGLTKNITFFFRGEYALHEYTEVKTVSNFLFRKGRNSLCLVRSLRSGDFEGLSLMGKTWKRPSNLNYFSFQRIY